MKIIHKALRAFLLLGLISFSTQSSAEDAQSLAQAIKIYKQGYNACVEAHTIRGSNLKEAKEKISFYNQKLEEATAIDKRILTTTEQNIDRNLSHCKTAKEDISRVEAFPLMEKALNECNKSKSELASGKFNSANTAFGNYVKLKKQASVLSSSLVKQPDITAKIRRCEKTGEKVKLANNQISSITKKTESQNITVKKALEICKAGQTQLNNKTLNKQIINNAKNQLTQSKSTLSQVSFSLEAAANSSQYGILPIHKSLQANINGTRKCHSALKAQIASKETAIANKLARAKAEKAEKERIQKEQQLKQQAANELAEKQKAEKLKKEKELAEKQKAEQAKKSALQKAQAEKKQKAIAKAKALKEEQAEDKKKKQAEKIDRKDRKQKANSSDWRSLVNQDDNGTSGNKESSSKKSSNRSDWTKMAPVNQ